MGKRILFALLGGSWLRVLATRVTHRARSLAAQYAALAALALLAGPVLGAEGPARATPDWIRDAVVYEVNPRAFSPEGSFAGITARLDQLRELGASVLWLMPVHEVGRERRKGSLGSPYSVRDYLSVDPAYGQPGDLKRLVREAHARGLKVILDVVLNHTAWDNPLLRRPGFHTRDAQGRVVSPEPDWSDVADLDYGNAAVREHMLGVLRYWLREYDLDGFRCDVAWLVPTDFWEEARRELETLKPGLFLLAEADEPALVRQAFDADYAWPFFHALDDVVWGQRPASALRAEWEREQARRPPGALRLRFSDNHDERRAVARLGERGAQAAAALVFTLDGLPLLYNGQEIGDTAESGAPALFERLPILWQMAERRPDVRPFFRDLIALRAHSPALRRGTVEWLDNDDPARVVSYVRRGEGQELLVAINLSNRPFGGAVAAPGPGWSERAWRAASTTPEGAGPARLLLQPWEMRVFERRAD